MLKPPSTLSPRITSALWPSGSRFPATWAILDGAQDERIVPAINRSYLDHCCLFAGHLAPSLRAVAPYLVRLEPGDQLTEFLLDGGWGRAWGIFVTSDASLKALRLHFRRFLRVTDENGRSLLFRYYDPRVLSVYLPTCNNAELTTVFGPVDRFAVESENGGRMIEYRFVASRLEKTYHDISCSQKIALTSSAGLKN